MKDNFLAKEKEFMDHLNEEVIKDESFIRRKNSITEKAKEEKTKEEKPKEEKTIKEEKNVEEIKK